MGEKYGTKETKELTTLTFEVGAFMIKRLSDGADWDDLKATFAKYQDPKFKKVVDDGIEGITLVDDEFRDADAGELFDMGKHAITELARVYKS